MNNGTKHLAQQLGAMLLPKAKKPSKVFEICFFDSEECKGDPHFEEFSSKAKAKQKRSELENEGKYVSLCQVWQGEEVVGEW